MCAAFPNDQIMQWFDIWNVSNFLEHEELQATGLRESVASLRRELANEATALGGRWDRLVLTGISQGAATGVRTLLRPGMCSAWRAHLTMMRSYATRLCYLNTASMIHLFGRKQPALARYVAGIWLASYVEGVSERRTLVQLAGWSR
jgi:hypothetical protein